jgi:hypothetical protein
MRIDQRRPLTEFDTEVKTLGCRHSNPNICKNNSTEGKCAFVREDNLCLLVPRSWVKIFGELKQEQQKHIGKPGVVAG